MRRLDLVRPTVAWATTAAFLLFGNTLLGDLASSLRAMAVFLWLFAVILWCAFGVVEQADRLAELLGEPLGTLVLTLSVITMEVALVAAVMLGENASPTLGRDTMFALLMIVLNGAVGLALLLGGLRHREQAYNLEGAVSYLTIIVPLSVIALVLPSVTRSTAEPTLTIPQAFFFSMFTVFLYGVFLTVQTIRHRHFFTEPNSGEAVVGPDRHDRHRTAPLGGIAKHTALLVLTMLPVVLLAKQLAKLVEYGSAVLGAPPALGGVLIALIIFTPEGMSALRAALADQLQRAVNLCLGAASSTIGLTVPAVLVVGLLTGQRVVLGLAPSGIVLLALTLLLSTITFSGPRTTILDGTVHLMLFLVYIVLIFSP